jgi:glycosyltransferase involved in cell wall biosynthesis
MNARRSVLHGGFSSSFCIDHRESRGLSTMTDAQPRPPGIRILVCSSGVPHETEGASVVLFFHYIRRLQQAGYDIVHLLLLEGTSWPQSAVSDYAATMKRSGAFQVEVVRSPGFVIHGRTGPRCDRDAFAQAADKATRAAPDVIVAFDILPAWMTAYVPARARLVWLGDLHFQSFFWNAIYAVAEDLRALKRFPSTLLACMYWKKIYRRVLHNADQVIVSSASSCRHLARLGIRAEYEPYPWPERVSPPRAPATSGCPTFLFFGNLVGLGSRSALHFMASRVYPRLLSRCGEGGFSILLAGRGELPQWFRKKISDKPEFRFLGYVEDIDAVMAQCHAVITPISAPVGNRSRILTAMAKGALVIAHRNSALGNPDLIDGKTCYLAEDGDGFVNRMMLAVRDKEASRAIADRARRCYESRFHPDIATGKLVDRVARLVAGNASIASLRASVGP